ncbi:MAG TPA: TadE/TadG family type IV pilus assembly protein [Caulobacteraceae bacterium]|nr:TadE/TadG family type IV pilus assembly protein [Caulobacteraceae bacterium]
MRGRLRDLIKREDGASAIEFALIAPVLGLATVLAFDVWMGATSVMQMRSAVETAAQYVMTGSSDDATTQSLAFQNWEDRPGNGAVTVTRNCMCGQAANVCTGLCPDQTPPAVYVTIQATGTGKGVFLSKNLQESQVVRVR